MARAKANTTKADTTEKQPVKKVALPKELSETFETQKLLKGAYLFDDGVWFFYENQAGKYEKKNEASRKYVANPHFGKE